MLREGVPLVPIHVRQCREGVPDEGAERVEPEVVGGEAGASSVLREDEVDSGGTGFLERFDVRLPHFHLKSGGGGEREGRLFRALAP